MSSENFDQGAGDHSNTVPDSVFEEAVRRALTGGLPGLEGNLAEIPDAKAVRAARRGE